MKFSIITISFLLSVLFFTHKAQYASFSGNNSKNQSEKVVVAYFSGSDIYRKVAYTVEDIGPIAHKLTHLIYAFAKPNPETNECELQDLWADVGMKKEMSSEEIMLVDSSPSLAGNFAQLLELKRKFPHIKLLLSIGGGANSKNISEIAQKGDIKKFAISCVALLDRYESSIKNIDTNEEQKVIFNYEQLFDGIDVDWEWKTNTECMKESQLFVDFVLLLKNLLQKRQEKQNVQQLLTCAVQANAKVYSSMQLSKIVSVVDWFHVMAYDFAGKFGDGVGFNAPLRNPWSSYSIDSAIQGLMNCGITSDKLVLGIPLYGQVFDQTHGKIGDAFQKTAKSGALSYRMIKERYLQDKACQYNWQSTAEVPSLYCPAYKIFVSFDNEQSIQTKIAYARKNRLRGIMLWSLAHDDEQHSLVKSI